MLLLITGSLELFAQNSSPISTSGNYTYIPLTTYEYAGAPFKINGPVSFLVTGNGFRAYYEIDNTSETEITGLQLWLLVYFQNKKKPVLYERTITTSVLPDSSRNFIWDEPPGDFGDPFSGMIVPYRVDLANSSGWYLSEHYAEAGEYVSQATQGNNVSIDGEPSYNQRSMKAIKVLNRPRIDGVLDDPVWEQVEFQGDFIQRVPVTGAPPTEKTEFAILYDDENVYFGVHMYESEPDKIRISEMRRDGSLFNDDSFEMVLDTFHNHRNAYNFIINAAGSVIDAMVGEDGKIWNRNWDGIWTAKTSIDDSGWSLEIAIPWQTLRFREGDDIIMGGNFVRRIIRKNEFDYWRLVPLYAGREGQTRISEAGDISGFNGLKMRGNFDFKPFLTGGLQRDDFVSEDLSDVGVDLKANITSTLTADFTYNTDFAQIEADQEQINLTRFDLFFPEKRDFFLEGSEIFSFGQGRGGASGFVRGATNIQLFHSRNIGIADGNPIPIIGGVRLNGKVGNNSLGMFSIQSKKTSIIDDEQGIPETNFSSFRLKRNVFSRSNVGVMFLNKEEIDGGYNRSIGFDSNFNVNEKFSFFLVGAGTYSPGESGKRNNFAGNAGLLFQSDLWKYNIFYLDIENSFNPEMGFLKRAGIKRTDGEIIFSPRLDILPSVRQLFFTVNGNYQTNHNNRILNKQVRSTILINFENTSSISFFIDREYEYLENDFEIRPALIIPQTGYTSTKYNGRIQFDRTKAISGSFNANWGDFFTGSTRGAGLNAVIRAHARVFASMNYNYNEIKLPNGQFHTNKLSTRLSYAFSTELFIKGFFQWTDDALLFEDRDRISQNIVMRYTYKPGSDFYMIYNQENLVGTANEELSNRTLLAKFTYLLRK